MPKILKWKKKTEIQNIIKVNVHSYILQIITENLAKFTVVRPQNFCGKLICYSNHFGSSSIDKCIFYHISDNTWILKIKLIINKSANITYIIAGKLK